MESGCSRYGLNGLNFFIAAVQTGFGPFVAVWLTLHGWSRTDVGLALSIGTAAALMGQLPGGWLTDAVHHKRNLVAGALLALAASALALAWIPTVPGVWGAEILHALASCVLTPAIAAMTLSLCGHDSFSERLGINSRFASLGSAAAAAALGAAASYRSERAVFLVTALLVIPAIAFLFLMRPADRLPPQGQHPALAHPRDREKQFWRVFGEPKLHVFAVCVVLFHVANTAMLPFALSHLTVRSADTGWVTSAAIIVPQIVVAAISPWVGGLAQRWGRRPVLLLGFAAVPLRGLLFATLPDAVPLVAIQVLDGLSAAVFGLMVPLIAADVTHRNGFMNIAIGSLGLAAGIGATVGTTLAGWIADHMGLPAAFVALSVAGLSSVGLLYAAMPETRPGRRTHSGTPAVAV